MTNRQLADSFLDRFPPDVCYESDRLALEALFNMVAEDERASLAAKLGWVCDEPTRPVNWADEVTA